LLIVHPELPFKIIHRGNCTVHRLGLEAFEANRNVEGLMAESVYRLDSPKTVVVKEANRHRLTELPAGSVFNAKCPKPDHNGMIDGTCNGVVVFMFSRDLDERAGAVTPKSPAIK
jgi:hypothetical protein